MQFNMPGPKSGILMLRVRRLLLLVAAFIAPTGAPSGVCSRAPKRGVAVHTAQTCGVLGRTQHKFVVVQLGPRDRLRRQLL